ncbi:MAG: family 43 glycosylhydrolase [Phycisphaerales bacterium]|nr:family 43 glycosylhydrolase [Phycisphaerales bacterium]
MTGFRVVCCVAWACVLAGPASGQVAPETRVNSFANPTDVAGADPDVLLDGGVYYMYATSAPSMGFQVWSSKDLVHWQQRGMALRKTDQSWGQRDYWAPCVVKAGNRYLMYYNAQPADVPAGSARAQRICVAESSSPLGPFKDVAAPIWDPGDMVIDGQVFIDRDGKGYLYYSNGSVSMVPLDKSLTKVAGDAVLCIDPSQEWEQKWNEGPYVMRRGDKYILFYSGPGYDMPAYSVGYAGGFAPRTVGQAARLADSHPDSGGLRAGSQLGRQLARRSGVFHGLPHAPAALGR